MSLLFSFFICICFAQVRHQDNTSFFPSSIYSIKLILLSFLLQICFCAPAEYLTDSRIDEIQSNLNEVNGLSSKCIDEMMEVFKQFRKETTKKQKIGAAVS